MILHLYITCTLNNIIFNITDNTGNSLYLISSGFLQFRTIKKTTFYSAKICLEKIFEKIKILKPKNIHVFIKGINFGRKAIIKDLKTTTLPIISITDITPIPFNGCRAKKQRRI
jgi:small subunit ribosomal protein S11